MSRLNFYFAHTYLLDFPICVHPCATLLTSSQHCTCGTLSSKCKPIPEKFIQGVELDHSPVQNAQACCDFCISVPGCTAWVLDKDGCTAKNQTTAMIHISGFVSGTLELCGVGSNPFPIPLNFQICPHMEATPQGGASVDACSAYCCATEACRSWQYLSSNPNTTACQTSPYRFTSCADTNVAWLGRSQNFPSPSPPPFPSPSPGRCGHNTSVIFPIDLANSTCLGIMRSPDGDESAFACYKVSRTYYLYIFIFIFIYVLVFL